MINQKLISFRTLYIMVWVSHVIEKIISLLRFKFEEQTDFKQSLFGFPSTHKSSSLMHCKGVPGQWYSVFSSHFSAEGNIYE